MRGWLTVVTAPPSVADPPAANLRRECVGRRARLVLADGQAAVDGVVGTGCGGGGHGRGLRRVQRRVLHVVVAVHLLGMGMCGRDPAVHVGIRRRHEW